ncbi:hypothetical protein VNO78_25024 [Psophocarpus tetragonolobus]|uniref:Uncharacterized protein n=1 Tax=Psophocarpus tetragonolobus TaxID=3891 RepID=A0AAN9S6J4_PSOTE
MPSVSGKEQFGMFSFVCTAKRLSNRSCPCSPREMENGGADYNLALRVSRILSVNPPQHNAVAHLKNISILVIEKFEFQKHNSLNPTKSFPSNLH